MGWWGEESKQGELLLGDEPLDMAGKFLVKLARNYKQDAERKPTPAEIVRTLEIALDAVWDDVCGGVEGKELAALSFRLKKRPVYKKVHAGDYFAVPLADGGFGYGRVIEILPKHWGLFEFFDLYSQELLPFEEVRKAPVLTTRLCDTDGMSLRRDWPVLGHVPIDPPPPEHKDFHKRFDELFGPYKGTTSIGTVRERELEAWLVQNPRWLEEMSRRPTGVERVLNMLAEVRQRYGDSWLRP